MNQRKAQRGYTVKVFQRIRYSVQFQLRRVNNASVGSISGSITHDNQRLRFSLNICRIRLFDWDERRQRVLPSHPRHAEINCELDRVIEQVHRFFSHPTVVNAYENSDGVSMLGRLRAQMFPHQNMTADALHANAIVRLFQRFIREYTNKGKSLSLGTIKQYKVVLHSWKAFEKDEGKTYRVTDFIVRSPMDEAATKKILERYRRFLTEKGSNGTPLSDNTLRNYLKILNTFFRWLERELGVVLVKGVRMSGEMVAKHSVSLTDKEVDRIRLLKLEPNSRLHHVRNMMILMTLTGLRFSEWNLIRPELYREPFQLIVSPKTGRSCTLIHRDEVRRILSEYDSDLPPN